MAQVFGYLLSNAIKNTDAGGLVSINAGVDVEFVWIQGGDTGTGISPEEQERIFEPFYRSSKNRRFPQGLGLGLTFARDILVAHGGSLELESASDKGSHFTIGLHIK